MAIHSLQFSQTFPITLEQAWDFISSPFNLEKITPEAFGIEIINGLQPGEKMYEGQIIEYTLRPLPFMKVKWVSEISQVKEKEYFIDEQRHGPYRMWRHQHFIKPVEGGVQMDDIIHYSIPYSLLGELTNILFVKRKLKSVFDYRRKKLEALFGKM